MKKFIVFFMLLTVCFIYAEEKVKLGFFVREGAADLEILKKVPINLIVTFENTIIFDSPIADWIKKQTEEKGKAPKVTVDGLKEEFLKSLDKVIKSGKPIKRVESKDKADRKYLIVMNIDRIVPVPMVGHTFSSKISIYEKSDLEKPISVMTHQIMEGGGSIKGLVTDKGIGQAGATIGSHLIFLSNNPKVVKSEK